MPGPLLLGKLLSADATHFQGLEMTFSSLTAGPRVDGTKKYRASAPQNCLRAKHPPQLERRPVSEETPFRETEWDSVANFYLCQQFVGGMKADEMERCSDIWWVLDKEKHTAAWIHGFHLRDSDSWHPSRGSQWSHNYRDVVRPRRERNVEIHHISSHSWGIGTWGLPVSMEDVWKRPLELMPRVEILSERRSASPQGLNTNICPRINHLLVRLSLFSHLFILPLIKMLSCSAVTAAFGPPQSNLGAETSQQMTPHKCRKRGTIDLCSRPNRFKSLITSVAGVHI